MGYNTTVLILNDSLDVIRNNPNEFVEKLYQQIVSGKSGDVSIQGHCNPVYVMNTQHADIPRVYFTHGNGITEIGRIPQEERRRSYWWEALKRAKEQIRLMEKTVKELKIVIPKYK